METTNKVVEVIDALCDKFGIAVDWASENMVPYVQSLMDKIVSYKLYMGIMWLCFIPLLTLGMFFAVKYCYKKHQENEYDELLEVFYIIAIIIFVIAIIGSAIAIICQVIDIITCVTFPEKVVIDYIMSMIGN